MGHANNEANVKNDTWKMKPGLIAHARIPAFSCTDHRIFHVTRIALSESRIMNME